MGGIPVGVGNGPSPDLFAARKDLVGEWSAPVSGGEDHVRVEGVNDATAPADALRTVNDAANWVSEVAFEHGVPRVRVGQAHLRRPQGAGVGSAGGATRHEEGA
ncbi:hypothetical protein GCM10010254_25710 [Streptomyces chromofuscus]|nr:hypothetical protein GCM10010254_25710 [Streptomyces chromofuscus]